MSVAFLILIVLFCRAVLVSLLWCPFFLFVLPFFWFLACWLIRLFLLILCSFQWVCCCSWMLLQYPCLRWDLLLLFLCFAAFFGEHIISGSYSHFLFYAILVVVVLGWPWFVVQWLFTWWFWRFLLPVVCKCFLSLASAHFHCLVEECLYVWSILFLLSRCLDSITHSPFTLTTSPVALILFLFVALPLSLVMVMVLCLSGYYHGGYCNWLWVPPWSSSLDSLALI